MKKLLYILVVISVILPGVSSHNAVPAQAADLKPWAAELAAAIEKQDWDQAHNLALNILKEQGYKQSGSEAVDWFVNSERGNILGKVQQETIQEIVAKNGDDAIEGIVNIGSHARWNNLKFIPGKSDVDFIFVGKKSAEADELFRKKLAQELGVSNVEDALSLTKIGPSNDRMFSKMQEIKTMEEALQKGEQDIATFLKRLNDPAYAEYYKNFGADKFIENYNWNAGSFDRVDVSGGKVTVVRDPGTKVGSLDTATIGEPTSAMKALYEKRGWKVPEMTRGDAWGLATNEYYFMQKEMQELAGSSASSRAVKLAKRAERLNEALKLADMEPPAEFAAQTKLLREGGTLTDEAAELYLKELDRMTNVTLERTLKAKIFDDLSRGWHPDWLTGNLKGEALDATVKFAETRKFLETTFGMNLIGKEKAMNLIENMNVPDYFKNVIKDEYGRALSMAGDAEQLSGFIGNQASKKLTVLKTAEEAGETAQLKSFIFRFTASAGGRMTLEAMDVGFRLFTVYDAYKENGWNGAANRAVLEGGAKWLAWKGITRADLALLVFDLSTMTVKMVGDAAMDEMRNDNVMGIYTGVIPQRESGLIFIGLKNDVKPNYTSLFEHLNITGLSDDVRSQVRSRLDGNQSFDKFIQQNTSWMEWAFGMSDERREELKDIYVSLANVNYTRGKLFDTLHPEYDKWVKAWEDAHPREKIDDIKNSAEYDLLVASLLDDVLLKYRTEHLAEIEAGGAWKGLDASTWDQIKDMIARDFKTGRSASDDRWIEEQLQNRFEKEKQQFDANEKTWFDKKMASLQGDAPSDSIRKMLLSAFGSGEPTPTNTLNISVSPGTVTEGLDVVLKAELSPPAKTTVEITIKNEASGKASTSSAVTGDNGLLETPILQITKENKQAWAGKNTVTAQAEVKAGNTTEKLTASASFTVEVGLKLTVTAEPEIIMVGNDITLKVEISPPVETELIVNFDRIFVELDEPILTDEKGLCEIVIPVGQDIQQGEYEVSVEAQIQVGKDFIVIQAKDTFMVVSKLSVLFDISPDPAKTGDVIVLDIQLFPPVSAPLDITVKNLASGYTQKFSDATDEKGTLKVAVLEIDTTNQIAWFDENRVTVKASVPSGDKTLVAEETHSFYVVPSVKMDVTVTPQTVVVSGDITINVSLTPPVETDLNIIIDRVTSFDGRTGPDGKFRRTLKMDTTTAGTYDVIVEAPNLGATGVTTCTVSDQLPANLKASIWVFGWDASARETSISNMVGQFSRGTFTAVSNYEGGSQRVSITLSPDLKTITRLEIADRHTTDRSFGYIEIYDMVIIAENIPASKYTIFPGELVEYFVDGLNCLPHVVSFDLTIDYIDTTGARPTQRIVESHDYADSPNKQIRVDFFQLE